MVIKIDLHTGREIAIAQALDLHQRELAVWRGLADSAAEFVFDPLGDLFRAPEPAERVRQTCNLYLPMGLREYMV